MLDKKNIFTRKRALTLVLFCAAALLLFILLRWHFSAGDDLSTAEGREMFLASLGWEVDLGSESHKSVIIPDQLDGVLLEYNKMQLEQGCDLNRHLGERCEQYTYALTNYPDQSQTVLVTLYIQGREWIAGDIHTTSINGFMHGLVRRDS